MRCSLSGGRVCLIRTVLSVALLAAIVLAAACSAPEPPPPPAVPPSTPATQTSPPASVPASPPVTTPAPEGAAEWQADGVVSPGEYAEELNLGSYRLFWSSTDDTLRMAMQADNQGWVAVGFQPGSRMRDADMAFGLMRDGMAVVLDSFSTGDFGPHRPDVELGGTDDLVSYGGARTGSMTTFEFERRLDTGDQRDVVLRRWEVTQVIWSYGSSDNERLQHSVRGYADIVP